MTRTTNAPPDADPAALLDENEQLRAALETMLEENGLLIEERERHQRRMGDLMQEMSAMREALSRQATRASTALPLARHSETEEELRVAFEELQVLTEELEVANTSLQQTNQQLDARVEERTRQLRQAHGTLAGVEASIRAIANLVPDLLWRADRHGEADWFNDRWMAHTGRALERSTGKGWLLSVHEDDRAATAEAWQTAVESGNPFQNEQRICDGQGEHRWFLVRAEAMRDARGRVVHWFAAGTDIHDQRVATEALRRSERRFRTLVEGMPQLVWRADDGGHWSWCSPQWSLQTGQRAEEARGLGWLDAVHPADRQHAVEAWMSAQSTGSLDIATRIRDAEGRYRHFRTRALPLHDDHGVALEWLGTSTDVDDMLRLREQQALLVAELQHRTRNLMGIVQAVMRRTLAGARTLDEFRDRIDDRLSALARVQNLLSRREGGTRVAFDVLIRDELSAHLTLDGNGDGPQVQLNGPKGISLRSATVQTLALALHELATNAVKYGALSVPQGRLRISWGVQPDESGGQRLWVDWRESGVEDMPSPDAAARGGGYGRELIERALPYQLAARTTYAFEADGVHCTVEVTVASATTDLETLDG
jgi:two-component system CheB/CheR fusion protein